MVTLTLVASMVLTAFNKLEVSAAKQPYQDMDYNLDIVSEEDWEKTKSGEYPLDFETDEVENLSYTEAIVACDMPDEYAKELSTEELVDYAMEYPFLTDVYFFDSIKEGMETLEMKSGLFKELFSREDGMHELLKEYSELNCDYDEVIDNYDLTESDYDAELFIEEYIGANYDSLSEKQAEKFIEKYGENYEDMPDELKDAEVCTSMYEVMDETLGYIPEDAIPENLADDIASGEHAGASFLSLYSELCGVCGAGGFRGTQAIQGKSISCFKHNSEASTATLNIWNANLKSYATRYGWDILRYSTAKYNCHSYAWYSTASKNSLCLDANSSVASIYQDTSYWTKWRVPMRNIKSGDRITFSTSTTVSSLQHSAIATSSTKCKSKLGHLGVVKSSIIDMKSLYGANTVNYYLAK